MSGGHFDYAQHKITDIAESIEALINKNEYAFDIIEEFKKGVAYLKIAGIYAQRIDWLVSGDDGEDSFRKRLKEKLAALESQKSEEYKEIHSDKICHYCNNEGKNQICGGCGYGEGSFDLFKGRKLRS